jgi:hypothetical protein
MPGPPPYEYPAARRYPTVFFTAVLLGYTSGPSGLTPDEQARARCATRMPLPGAMQGAWRRR